MKCPKCGATIDIKPQMREWGAKGGKKSKRLLTSEEAKKMVEIREARKQEKDKP